MSGNLLNSPCISDSGLCTLLSMYHTFVIFVILKRVILPDEYESMKLYICNFCIYIYIYIRSQSLKDGSQFYVTLIT